MMSAMDYAEARATFFQPRSGDIPQSGRRSPARALRDAMEPIAMICYWGEPANDAYAALGLDFLQGYVWGRASTLGEPSAGVVASAFGVFEPGLVAELYAAGRAKASIEQIREARERGSVAALEQVLGSPDGLGEIIATLRRGAEAGDPTGRPLYAGLRDLPWPEHPLGQLWHGCTMLREFRGDTHLATCVATGLSGLEANLLTELHVGWDPHTYTATRGWSPEAMTDATTALESRGLVADGALTEQGAALRSDVEEATDMLVAPVLRAIDSQLAVLVNTLDVWSRKVVEAGAFPPDPLKRAAG